MVVREKGAFDLTWRCLISSQERFARLSQQKGRGAGTYWTGNLGPKFWEAFAAGSAGKCGRCWARVLRRCAPGRGVHALQAWETAPHIFFCLGKRKRAAPGTKENRLFIGLLVRPEQMGLVSSSCAKPLALPVRSRRICFIGCKPEGAKRTRGPSCAAAARPGIRSKFLPRRCIHVLLLPTERQRRCCGKQSYLHQRFSISETATAQASWARQTLSAAGNSQTGYCPMFS